MKMTTTNQKETKRIKATARAGEFRELAVPYWFSSVARRRGENLEISDYVEISGLDKRYEIVDIFPQFGSVRVRAIGEIECMLLPWGYVTPWRKEGISSQTAFRAVIDWLFRGSRLYLLSEPDRILKQKKIHWNTQSVDVEDQNGRVLYGSKTTGIQEISLYLLNSSAKGSSLDMIKL